MDYIVKNTYARAPGLCLLAWVLSWVAVRLELPLVFVASLPLVLFGVLGSQGENLRKLLWMGLGTFLCIVPWNPWPSTHQVARAMPVEWVGEVRSVVDGPDKIRFRIWDSLGQGWAIRLSGECQPTAGEKWLIQGKVMPGEVQRNPGGFDYADYLRSQGLSGSILGECASAQKIAEAHVWDLENRVGLWGRVLAQRMDRLYSAEAAGLLKGMLLGNASYLTEDLADDFRSTGLSHILAISGFHIALFAVVLHLLFGLITPSRFWQYGLTLAFLAIYTPMTGSSPSVVRAVVFYALFALGKAMGRKVDAIHTLCLTGALLLIWNPLNLLSLGFQLSFGATFALLIGAKITATSHRSWWRTWLWDPTQATLWATLGTAPVLMANFYTLAPASLLGNLFAVPLTTAFMITGGLGLLGPEAWTMPWRAAAEATYQWTQWSVGLLAQIPGAQWNTGAWPGGALVGLCALPVLLTLRQLWVARVMIYVCVGGILLWPLAQAMQKAAFPELKLWVLDVGQGDGLWIETPGGHHIVVDAGAKTGSGDQGKWTLVPFAQWLGVSSIDALVLTHADLDHVGGALSLMKKISVGSIWTNPQDLANPKPELVAVLAEAQSRNIPVLPWTAGQTLRFADGVVLQGLHPMLGREFAEGNHASVTLLLEYAGRRALLTGDLEEEGEEEFLVNWPNLQIDLLKAGHHGSKNATSAELLEQTRPEWALISAGRNNRYHHPHPDVVARLTQRGIGLLGTYDWGALQWSVDSKGQMLLKRHLAGELIRGN